MPNRQTLTKLLQYTLLVTKQFLDCEDIAQGHVTIEVLHSLSTCSWSVHAAKIKAGGKPSYLCHSYFAKWFQLRVEPFFLCYS